MTEMMKYWDDEKKQKMAETIPVKRLGTVQDMSYLMMFLPLTKPPLLQAKP